MRKKVIAALSLVVILSFIGYIIYDTIATDSVSATENESIKGTAPEDQWEISKELLPEEGPLLSVAVSENGQIYLGGDYYLSCYNEDFSRLWSTATPGKITAISVNGDTIFAASVETILLYGTDGKLISEWGPYEAKSIITSLSSDKKSVVFADAGTKRVFILKKDGEVVAMMGHGDDKFIIPSPYFDVALGDGNTLYAANTGHRRIETWTTDGKLQGYFGEPGTAPGAFCGCCNPAHFTVVPQGFITAEKGINRIKILDKNGEFTEFVSSANSFKSSVPLDIASSDGLIIYAANPDDSKLYVFRRKNDG